MASRFHVREDVAPLKLLVALLCFRSGFCFHVREDVAPLKHKPGSAGAEKVKTFPRS